MARIAKIKGSKPEHFALVLEGMLESGTPQVGMMTEPELRAWLGEKIQDKAKIDSIIAEARNHEV
jgi:hypothetical protein